MKIPATLALTAATFFSLNSLSYDNCEARANLSKKVSDKVAHFIKTSSGHPELQTLISFSLEAVTYRYPWNKNLSSEAQESLCGQALEVLRKIDAAVESIINPPKLEQTGS